MRRSMFCLMILFLVLGGALTGQDVKRPDSLALRSAAFSDGGTVPLMYTCKGKDISPPMSWINVPQQAQSLALTCLDPDAPGGRWVHWVVYGILPVMTELRENRPRKDFITGGACQGKNDFGRLGWGGPCPPPGPEHHYVFTLYALDANLELKPGLTLDQVNAAIKGHVVAEARLTGLFRR